MATFLDLPDEIRLLIVKQLHSRSIHSLIHVCRSFYFSFIPCLWSDFSITHSKSSAVPAEVVRTNAHRIEAITFSVTLTQEYYAITYPRLIKWRMMVFHNEKPTYLQVQLQDKLDFARRHPFITAFKYRHKDTLPREFWEVIGTVWKSLDELEFTGYVDTDAVDLFWKVCERVQTLNLTDAVMFSESLPILSTLFFTRLRELTIVKYLWHHGSPRRLWPVQILERAKESEHLRKIDWGVGDVDFPVQTVLDAFAEDCWPNLCELSIGGAVCSGGLQTLEWEIRAVDVQVLEGVVFWAFEGSKSRAGSWGNECDGSGDSDRVDDEAEWEERVFAQIGRLKRMCLLDLQRDPNRPSFDDDRSLDILTLQTLTLQLSGSSSSSSSSIVDDFATTASGGIRNWSSLLQLKEFSFDGDRQWMGVKELEWMVEHWKNLTSLTGDFRAAAGSSDSARMKQLLDQHKIMHYCDTLCIL
ncbi:hypothetical protein BGZ97_008518 [Linnemannia gamsii]|uniref:F-box domain-containing protein n=1 Tax=Linnemannia gamsii TaxID=64522 RepID=A0A9P6RBM0_9FUNG|nr:hypothetical protein BGZ97_008518 [Linnemannia gamsii]